MLVYCNIAYTMPLGHILAKKCGQHICHTILAMPSLKGLITDWCTVHVVQDMLSTGTCSLAVFGRCTVFNTCTLPEFLVRQQQTCDIERTLAAYVWLLK